MNADRLGLSRFMREKPHKPRQKRPNSLTEKRSAAGYHSVRLTERTDFKSCPSFFSHREYVHGKVYSRLKFGLDLETEGGKWLL